MNVMTGWKTFKLVSILHFTPCKGQKDLDKNLYLQLQYILSPAIIFLSPLPSLSYGFLVPSVSPRFHTFLWQKLERLMNCLVLVVFLLPWWPQLFLCWLECRTMNIQPEIMLAIIGAIYVNPVTVRQLELSFRQRFNAQNQTSPERSLKCRPASPLCRIAPNSIVCLDLILLLHHWLTVLIRL